MRSPLTIAFHSILSLIILAMGIYVLIEKKMFIGGSLSPGKVYEFDFPANVITATSFLLVSVFIMLVLVKGKWIKRICEGLLIVALILFFAGAFM